MPRRFNRVRTPLLTEERARRSKRYRQFRLGEWVDPYPNVKGTRPEKMVYELLMRYRIPFYFQNWFRVNLPELGYDSFNNRPDFIIPDKKLIIEVQGFYWHSQPEQIEDDAFKYALYEQMGYKVITWWDFDIESRRYELFASEPDLMALRGNGGRIITGDEYEERDDSAGIRSANQARTDYGKRQAQRYTTKGRKSRSIYSYGTV